MLVISLLNVQYLVYRFFFFFFFFAYVFTIYMLLMSYCILIVVSNFAASLVASCSASPSIFSSHLSFFPSPPALIKTHN